MTRTFDLVVGKVVDVVTLIPRTASNASIGSLVVPSPAPPIICRCMSPTTGSAIHGGLAIGTTTQKPLYIDAHADFEPELRVFSDSSFEHEVEARETFPATSPRFYFEASSPNAADIVGFVNCSTSPSEQAGSPHAMRFLESSCPVGVLDFQAYNERFPHIARMSLQAHSFFGMDYVYVSCILRRCPTEPCGACAGDSRRLGKRVAELKQETKTVTFRLYVGLIKDAMVLPEHVPAEQVDVEPVLQDDVDVSGASPANSALIVAMTSLALMQLA